MNILTTPRHDTDLLGKEPLFGEYVSQLGLRFLSVNQIFHSAGHEEQVVHAMYTLLPPRSFLSSLSILHTQRLAELLLHASHHSLSPAQLHRVFTGLNKWLSF